MKLWQTLTRSDPSISLDDWASYFTFNGLQYPLMGLNQTLGGTTEQIDASFAGYVQGALKSNGVVFACELARLLLFSEARFKYRRLSSGRPGDLFGSPDLKLLEQPWPNGTTGDLLTRMLQDVDLAGNFYGYRRTAQRLVRMRPDWVTIVMGSMSRPDAQIGDLDVEVLGYVYQPGGPGSGRPAVPLLREQVAHFAPIPDPLATYRGMSWLTPVINEILGDQAATRHKQKFFENGATANMVVTLDASVGLEAFERFKAVFEGSHRGLEGAYETIFLGGGADVKVGGSDMKQLDFKVTQGHGETRIAAAAGVPPVIVGLSEGLEAATYSNYGQARRRFADGTMRPLWRNAAGSLAPLINVPAGAELWYDDRDIPFLQEDQKDAADIQQTQSVSIKQLVEAGFTPESVVQAVMAGDLNQLQHTGMFSVQLQQPGTQFPAPAINGSTPPALNAPTN